MCKNETMCLADKCNDKCLYDLKECNYGGAGVECAPSYGGFVKSESTLTFFLLLLWNTVTLLGNGCKDFKVIQNIFTETC